ncbi:MAG: hypothetical protein ABWZ75_07460 [Novosphingobium sp.]
MSRGTPPIEGSTAAQDALRDWEAVRASGDIQFKPLTPGKPNKPPEWLLDAQKWLADLFEPLGKWFAELFGPIGRFLRGLFEPLARWLGISWPVFEKILFGLAVLGVLVLVWRIVAPLIAARSGRKEGVAEENWAPTHAAAVALLEDADRLASEGRFGEAVHLLLQRSVSHIAEAQPDWLLPASTAREIAGLELLPLAARQAFGVIATRVERSLFALRDLDAGDWQAARSAYADFALTRFAA